MLPETAGCRAKAKWPVADVENLRVIRERQKTGWILLCSLAGIYVRLLARSMLLFSAIQAPGAGTLVFIGYAAHAGGCWISVVSAILGCLGPGGADPLIEAIPGFGGGYRDAIRGKFRWLPY